MWRVLIVVWVILAFVGCGGGGNPAWRGDMRPTSTACQILLERFESNPSQYAADLLREHCPNLPR